MCTIFFHDQYLFIFVLYQNKYKQALINLKNLTKQVLFYRHYKFFSLFNCQTPAFFESRIHYFNKLLTSLKVAWYIEIQLSRHKKLIGQFYYVIFITNLFQIKPVKI
ncbi:hypothetical protein DW671_12980 [Mediterraneibacter gnavus]|nr:hypothetical protein DW671_12980 [Mediterraneibacter gnavus]